MRESEPTALHCSINPSCKAAVESLDQKGRANFRPKETFFLSHFVQLVQYTAADFLEKNCDHTSVEIEGALANSRVPLLRELFATSLVARDPASFLMPTAPTSTGDGGTYGFASRTFASSLRQLMQELEATAPFFIRCIKPNDALAPGACDDALVLTQLQACGMLQATHMIRAMYPSRAAYKDVLSAFSSWLYWWPGSQKDLVELICASYDVPPSQYSLGKTRVFFTSDCPEHLTRLCQGATIGDMATAERVVVQWKIQPCMREFAVIRGIHRWMKRALGADHRPQLSTVECVHRYRELRRAMVMETLMERNTKKLQAWMRGARGRQQAAQQAQRLLRQRSAITLQTATRGMIARRECTGRRRHRASIRLQTAERRRVCRTLYQRKRRGASVIQAAVRVHLARLHAATKIQAAVRRFRLRAVLRIAREAARVIQAKWRAVRIRLLCVSLCDAVAELRRGEVLSKYFEGGIRSEHLRRVWLSDDLNLLCWAKVTQSTTGNPAQYKSIDLNTVSAVSDGVKTHCLKRVERGKESIFGGMTEILLGGTKAFQRDACFSILCDASRADGPGVKSRTLDFMADSNKDRDRWLRNLRLLLVHRRTIDLVGGDGLLRLRGVIQTTVSSPDRSKLKSLDGGQRAMMMGMSTAEMPRTSKRGVGLDRSRSFRKASDLLSSVSFGTRTRSMQSRSSAANRRLSRVDAHGLPLPEEESVAS